MLHYPNDTKKSIKKYLVLFMSIVCISLFAIYIPLAWFYSEISTNIAYDGTWLPFVVHLLLNLIDIAIFASAYFCITYAFFRLPKKTAWIFPILYLVLALCRRALTLMLQFIVTKYIGPDEFISLGFYYFLEVILLGIALLIVILECKKCAQYVTAHKKAGVDIPEFLPFSNVVNKNNPLQVCSFKLAVMIAGTKILTRIISDIYYGAPESFLEGLVMAVYYCSDLLNGLIFYTLLWYLFTHINKKETALCKNKTDSQA